MDNMIAISSWSGGKDSCLACHKAIQQGYQIKYLLHFISRGIGKYKNHPLRKSQ